MKRMLCFTCVVIMSCCVITGWTIQDQEGKKTFPAPPKDQQGAPLFAGTWNGTYTSNLVPPTKVTLIFQQRGTTVTGTYLSLNGAQGVMFGTVNAQQPSQLTADQKTPTCTGQFAMAATVNGNQMQWSFKGQDCLGAENGTGTATRVAAKQ